MRCVWRKYFGRAVVGSLSLTIFVWPVAGAESAARIPDLSGYWGRDVFNLEAPPSGPGPITNTMRKADGTIDDVAARVGDYTSPLFKPGAAEVLRRRGEFSLTGMSIPDPHNQCWPEPPPFVLSIQLAMQLLQSKDEVTVLYMYDQKVRRIRMNVPHPAQVTPSWQGDFVGHYEGDTLVIDTVGIKTGPLAVIDRYGTPYSEALHVIERYRLIDGAAAREAQRKHEATFLPAGAPNPAVNAYGQGTLDPDTNTKGLQVEVTVDDAGVFTSPWTGLVTYRRWIGEWVEVVCSENLREPTGPAKQVPVAEALDF